MSSGLSRREALRLGLLGLGALAVGRVPAAVARSTVSVAAGIGAAALRFLASLEGDARARALFAFEEAERVRWHWTNTVAVPRNGLALGDMSAAQRQLAFDLLRASSSA